jgi:hypothetical protein
VSARCYFDRASAVDQESFEEAEERAQILADAAVLKKRAIMYAHPGLPVVTSDTTATARCYFDRASAVDRESFEEAEERAQILADAAVLKKSAIMYAHPELPVVTSDATATARCYFDRASAIEQESVEKMEEREAVLADAATFKRTAVAFLHPELPVVTSDATATARCHFDRASAAYDADEIISTSAYSAEKTEEESLQNHMQKIEALAPASNVKTVPAAGLADRIEEMSNPIRAHVDHYCHYAPRYLASNIDPLYLSSSSSSSSYVQYKTLYDVGPTKVGVISIDAGASIPVMHGPKSFFHVLEDAIYVSNDTTGEAKRCVAGNTVMLPEGWSGHVDVTECTKKLWTTVE